MLGEHLPHLEECPGWCLGLSCSAGDVEHLHLEPWVRGPWLCSMAMVALANCSLSLHYQRFVVNREKGRGSIACICAGTCGCGYVCR